MEWGLLCDFFGNFSKLEMVNFTGGGTLTKTLTRETKYSHFIYAEKDAETMNSARDIVNSTMKGDELIKQWKIKHDGEIRAKNKAKQRETWEKWWGEYLTPHGEPKDPETSSTISMGYNTMRTSTYTKEP